jgi:5-methylcytosine-specific restriction endonuclease McrA
MRRTELKARTSLRRTTPLRARAAGMFGPGSSLKRTPPRHAKRKGLKPVSGKRRAENRQRRKMADAVFGPAPECGIRWDANCRGLADDLHETLSRARSGGDITNPDICVPACRPCHSRVDDNPAEAEHRGFLLPSGRPRKAVGR